MKKLNDMSIAELTAVALIMVDFIRARCAEEITDAESLLAELATSRAAGRTATIWEDEEAGARRAIRVARAHLTLVDLHSGTLHRNEAPCPSLLALVAVHADHPDYDPSWSPA